MCRKMCKVINQRKSKENSHTHKVSWCLLLVFSTEKCYYEHNSADSDKSSEVDAKQTDSEGGQGTDRADKEA